MNTQEIIEELTRSDRLVIREGLSGVYSRRYIDYMFDNGRKRTELFRNVVQAYWNSKQGLIDKVEDFINEFKNKEVTV